MYITFMFQKNNFKVFGYYPEAKIKFSLHRVMNYFGIQKKSIILAS